MFKFIRNDTKELITAIFEEIIKNVRNEIPEIKTTVEFSQNDAFPLRAILRLSLQDRSILATVDFQLADCECINIWGDICLDNGKLFEGYDPSSLKSLKEFFGENTHIFLEELKK